MATHISDGSKHPFHIVEPSPWPFLSALFLFITVVGAVLNFHGHPWYLLAAGLLGVVTVAVLWWRDVINEACHDHTPQVQRGFRYGMALFIASEACFFAAFFWAYFHAGLFPTAEMGNVWPPKGIEVFDPFDIPYLNTLVLLLSGTTVTWAHHSLIEGKMQDAAQKTLITVILGICFTSLQAYEYIHAPFKFTAGIYPSNFYMATGFHGLHVIVGTIFLIVTWLRIRKGHFTKSDHFGFEAAAWYWHFVDVVWLFLFVSIYWWGSY